MSLDARANRLDRETKKAAAAAKVPALNPPFPWRAIAFDPWAFGVEKDPPKPAKKSGG